VLANERSFVNSFDERRVLTVSRVQDGAFGLADVALSLPAIVGAHGVDEILEPDLDTGERSGLEESAEVIRTAIGSVS
jgi:L-lactate dehydrogenase